MYRSELLEVILLTPLLGIILVLFVPKKYGNIVIMELSLFITIITFIFNIIL